MLNCILVGAGGFVGAVARYWISFLQMPEKTHFPYATLLTNVLGAFFIGIIMGIFLHGNAWNPRLVLFLKVGVCGGFTTFSTFALESSDLLSGGKLVMGVSYIVLSVVLCIFAVILGENILAK